MTVHFHLASWHLAPQVRLKEESRREGGAWGAREGRVGDGS